MLLCLVCEQLDPQPFRARFAFRAAGAALVGTVRQDLNLRPLTSGARNPCLRPLIFVATGPRAVLLVPVCCLRCRQLAAGYWPCSCPSSLPGEAPRCGGGSTTILHAGSRVVSVDLVQPDSAASWGQPSVELARASSGSAPGMSCGSSRGRSSLVI